MRPLPAACAAAVVVLGLVAACASGPRAAQGAGITARTVTAARSVAPAASPSAAPGGIFTRGFVNPSLTFTGGRMYLTWQSSAQPYPPRMTLSRADPATGAIVASNTFSPGLVGPPVYAAGWLWVTDDPASVSDLLLLRLDPSTLMVTGELSVGSDPTGNVGTGGHIAFAGGATGGPARNYCADPATGRRLATLPLPNLAQDYLMTVHAGTIYYSVPADDGFAIRTVPVPTACG
jgi:hypothetical protein